MSQDIHTASNQVINKYVQSTDTWSLKLSRSEWAYILQSLRDNAPDLANNVTMQIADQIIAAQKAGM